MREDRRPWGRLDQLAMRLAFAIVAPHLAGMMFRLDATPVREWLPASRIRPSSWIFLDFGVFAGWGKLV